MKTMLLFLTLICIASQLWASNSKTQEIRGRIIDKVTGEPLEGVNISLKDNQTPIGTISDKNGEFRLWNVPNDLSALKISLSGYETTVINYPFEQIENDLPFVIELQDKVKIKKKLRFPKVLKNQKAKNNIVLLATE